MEPLCVLKTSSKVVSIATLSPSRRLLSSVVCFSSVSAQVEEEEMGVAEMEISIGQVVEKLVVRAWAKISLELLIFGEGCVERLLYVN